MRKILSLLLTTLTLFCFVGCQNQNNNAPSGQSPQVNRTSTSISNNPINDNENPTENGIPDNAENQDNPNNSDNPADPNNPVDPNNQDAPASPDDNNSGDQVAETVASEFTTKILTKSKNRATNIGLTCDKINGVTVKAGQEFSFCQTIGTSKESEGYKKADVIVGKKVVQALGGGNCQVSSTLFNAVLSVSELKVTERHPHGKKVNYVPEGKDAAIAHGSKDFKFKNESSKDLKIYASSDDKQVYIKLVFLG